MEGLPHISATIKAEAARPDNIYNVPEFYLHTEFGPFPLRLSFFEHRGWRAHASRGRSLLVAYKICSINLTSTSMLIKSTTALNTLQVLRNCITSWLKENNVRFEKIRRVDKKSIFHSKNEHQKFDRILVRLFCRKMYTLFRVVLLVPKNDFYY